MGQGSVLHEVINSGQTWAADRAAMALQVHEALSQGQMSQDEAREILNDLINTEKLDNEANTSDEGINLQGDGVIISDRNSLLEKLKNMNK